MVYELIGWAGSSTILLAYFLVSTKRIIPGSKEYQLLNLFGSAGLILNSTIHRAIPLIGLNAAWILIALYGLLKALKK